MCKLLFQSWKECLYRNDLQCKAPETSTTAGTHQSDKEDKAVVDVLTMNSGTFDVNKWLNESPIVGTYVPKKEEFDNYKPMQRQTNRYANRSNNSRDEIGSLSYKNRENMPAKPLNDERSRNSRTTKENHVLAEQTHGSQNLITFGTKKQMSTVNASSVQKRETFTDSGSQHSIDTSDLRKNGQTMSTAFRENESQQEREFYVDGDMNRNLRTDDFINSLDKVAQKSH